MLSIYFTVKRKFLEIREIREIRRKNVVQNNFITASSTENIGKSGRSENLRVICLFNPT